MSAAGRKCRHCGCGEYLHTGFGKLCPCYVTFEAETNAPAALLARAESAEAELRAARSALASIKAGMVGSIAEGIADVGVELARCRKELAELRGPKVLNVT